MQEWITQFNHLDYVKDHIVIAGGLSFNKPQLSTIPLTLTPIISSTDNERLKFILNKNKNNPIITNIGKPTSFQMAREAKVPIELAHIEPNNLSEINVIGKTSGILDMWIKKSGTNSIVIPKELVVLQDIILEAYNFEAFTNKDIFDWNMWLLVDIRPIKRFHTQRNSGFHYDGMALCGKYQNCPVTSIYSWTNKLPTQFYIGSTTFPESFKNYHNANIFAQKQVKENHQILTTKPFYVNKFDATTIHTGVEACEDIDDRVFVRICFTAPHVLFDRKGNTINPCLSYDNFNWRVVKDPIVTFKTLVCFDNPNEFKNLWDVACQGHPAFSCQYEGLTSFEYRLIKKLKQNYPISFVKAVSRLYDKEINSGNILSNIRKELLIHKYF